MTTSTTRPGRTRRRRVRATVSRAASYARGRTDVPLLEETIGANFDRTVAAHGSQDA